MAVSAQVIEDDCLKWLKSVESESIDAIITDPPYGINYQSSRTTADKRKPKIRNDKSPFIWWLFDAYRVLRPNSPLIVFCRWDVAEDFRKAIEWAGFDIRSQVIWDRGVHGMGDLNGAFAPQHDTIWFATKGKYKFPGKRPKSVIKVNRVHASYLQHPNEKPIELIEMLIESLTIPGAVILDPFAGGGSTLVGAVKLGRKSIGVEIDHSYCDLMINRLSNYI